MALGFTILILQICTYSFSIWRMLFISTKVSPFTNATSASFCAPVSATPRSHRIVNITTRRTTSNGGSYRGLPQPEERWFLKATRNISRTNVRGSFAENNKLIVGGDPPSSINQSTKATTGNASRFHGLLEERTRYHQNACLFEDTTTTPCPLLCLEYNGIV